VSSIKPSHNTGFTLIEVLVSITMMAMVAAIVVTAMRSGVSVWNKGTSHIESLRRSRVVLDILDDQLRGAVPLSYTVRTSERPANVLAFDGSRIGIRFVSRSSFKEGPDGIPRWIDLQWNGDPQKAAGDLIVEERRILPPDNLPDSVVVWRGSVLHAETCSFHFLMDAQQSKPPAWLEEWHYPMHTTLPKAVRLNCLAAGKTTTRLLVPLDYYESSIAGFIVQ
jgi:prepilin-type N-terminal cleavage/methylation domain-containing protein